MKNNGNISRVQHHVSRYLNDFSRVLFCFRKGFSADDISFASSISKKVVNQYLEILEEFGLEVIGIESETRLRGKGVSACATCDAMFFKNKDVCVIGAGDTALREALHLVKMCKTVTLIHRRDEMRGQKVLQERALNTKNMKFIWNTTIEEFIGKNKLESLKLKNVNLFF